MNLIDWLKGLFNKPAVPQQPKQIMKASFFAGPQDTAAYRHCRTLGGSPNECFKTGDNGIGAWDADTTVTDICYFALPHETWLNAGKKGGDKGYVTYKGKRVEGVLGDTLPWKKNIHNGVGIDLNPGFAVAFGIPVEHMNNYTLEDVQFEWAD